MPHALRAYCASPAVPALGSRPLQPPAPAWPKDSLFSSVSFKALAGGKGVTPRQVQTLPPAGTSMQIPDRICGGRGGRFTRGGAVLQDSVFSLLSQVSVLSDQRSRGMTGSSGFAGQAQSQRDSGDCKGNSE